MRKMTRFSITLLYTIAALMIFNGCLTKTSTPAAGAAAPAATPTPKATAKPTATPGSAGTPSPTATPVVIPGSSSAVNNQTFSTPCQGITGLTTRNVIHFNSGGTAGTYVNNTYYDSNCTSVSYSQTITLTSITLGTIDPTTGRFDINATMSDTFLHVYDSNGASGLNTAHECGYTSWAIADNKDMQTAMGLTCPSNSIPIPSGGFFGSMWLTGNPGSLVLTMDKAGDGGSYTGCGSHNDSSSGNRCTSEGTDTPNDTFLEN